MSDHDDMRDAHAAKVARADAWSWILHDPRGRLVISQLLQISDPLGASMTASDPLVTAMREGQRSIGLAIYMEIMASAPTQWAKLHAELGTPRENHEADV